MALDFFCTMSECSLPSKLLQWVDGWGQDLKKSVAAALAAARAEVQGPWSKVHSERVCGPDVLHIGTDCSGVEAPIHAVQGLRIQYRHSWSSEIAAAPKKVLLANTPPRDALFGDVLSTAVGIPPFVHLYVSGFSCRPFSMLHNQSALLDEPEAKVFYGVARRIRMVRPPVFVLENVQGIKRVLPQVLETLECEGAYVVSHCDMDPVQLGEPVQRPRIYFFGVRKDVALVDAAIMSQVIASAWSKVRGPRSKGQVCSLAERLLPNTHPAVLKHQASRQHVWKEVRLL